MGYFNSKFDGSVFIILNIPPPPITISSTQYYSYLNREYIVKLKYLYNALAIKPISILIEINVNYRKLIKNSIQINGITLKFPWEKIKSISNTYIDLKKQSFT